MKRLSSAAVILLIATALIQVRCKSEKTASKPAGGQKTASKPAGGQKTASKPAGGQKPASEPAGGQKPAVLRILPLGNSITQGKFDLRSYRYALWKKLVDEGISFDFIGSMQVNHNGSPKWPKYKGKSFDTDHEGHWGWRVDEILAKLPGWLDKYTPDLVLLHLGSNDMLQKQTVESTVAELKQVIDLLRKDNPKVVILLAKILPIRSRKTARMTALNQVMDKLAKDKHTEASPVLVVDQNTGFDPVAELTDDKVHPNEAGEEKMATRWLAAIKKVLSRKPATARGK